MSEFTGPFALPLAIIQGIVYIGELVDGCFSSSSKHKHNTPGYMPLNTENIDDVQENKQENKQENNTKKDISNHSKFSRYATKFQNLKNMMSN
jgi:hypothetical protein